MTNPFYRIAAELARFAVNVDLIAESINGRPGPLSEDEATLLTTPVAHLSFALMRLEEALQQTDRVEATSTTGMKSSGSAVSQRYPAAR